MNVPLLDIPAIRANVSPDRERLLNDLAAVKAPLRGEARRHFANPYSSFLRFEYEDVLESIPTRVRDGASKVAVLEHILDSQVLNRDEGVPIHVVPRRLVRVVLALAGYSEVDLRRLSSRLAPAARAFLSTRRLALRPPEFLRRPHEAARVLDNVAIRVGDEVREANVKADASTIPFLRCISEIADDEDIPVPVGAIDEVSGFGTTFELPVLLDLEAATELLGNPQPPGSFAGVEEHVSSAPVLTNRNAMPAVSGFEARKANLLTKLFAVKKSLESLVESAREGLNGRLGDVLRAGATATSFEPIREVVATKELACLVIMSLDHLQHLVVKLAAFRQAREEHRVLGAVDEKPVLESLVHCPGDTANRDSAQRVFIRQLKQAVLNPSFR